MNRLVHHPDEDAPSAAAEKPPPGPTTRFTWQPAFAFTKRNSKVLQVHRRQQSADRNREQLAVGAGGGDERRSGTPPTPRRTTTEPRSIVTYCPRIELKDDPEGVGVKKLEKIKKVRALHEDNTRTTAPAACAPGVAVDDTVTTPSGGASGEGHGANASSEAAASKLLRQGGDNADNEDPQRLQHVEIFVTRTTEEYRKKSLEVQHEVLLHADGVAAQKNDLALPLQPGKNIKPPQNYNLFWEIGCSEGILTKKLLRKINMAELNFEKKRRATLKISRKINADAAASVEQDHEVLSRSTPSSTLFAVDVGEKCVQDLRNYFGSSTSSSQDSPMTLTEVEREQQQQIIPDGEQLHQAEEEEQAEEIHAASSSTGATSSHPQKSRTTNSNRILLQKFDVLEDSFQDSLLSCMKNKNIGEIINGNEQELQHDKALFYNHVAVFLDICGNRDALTVLEAIEKVVGFLKQLSPRKKKKIQIVVKSEFLSRIVEEQWEPHFRGPDIGNSNGVQVGLGAALADPDATTTTPSSHYHSDWTPLFLSLIEKLRPNRQHVPRKAGSEKMKASSSTSKRLQEEKEQEDVVAMNRSNISSSVVQNRKINFAGA
ncbi:unnamed protein product [Amoebophrya sp. A120]|nr:unnamed protein product [Amoebophrya sp. A120]|eukprot:GSA120T00013200001.1